MARLAAQGSVFFLEEPMFGRGPDRLEIRNAGRGVVVLVPWLASASAGDGSRCAAAQSRLLHSFLSRDRIAASLLWYYTPAPLAFTEQLAAKLVVYDCMDGAVGAHGQAPRREAELLRRADLVFTAGRALHEAKRNAHPRVHLCPDGVDLDHFRRARAASSEPLDQAGIARPRVGFAGAIDERIDLALLAGVAQLRPELQFVMLGPVSLDADRLPAADNIHWLGKKPYAELPSYLSGWDAAMLPFVRHAAQLPGTEGMLLEYLAAGRPVVSAAVCDAIRPHAERGFVRIARNPEAFARALDAALPGDPRQRWALADQLLPARSWDRTVERMRELIDAALRERRPAAAAVI